MMSAFCNIFLCSSWRIAQMKTEQSQLRDSQKKKKKRKTREMFGAPISLCHEESEGVKQLRTAMARNAEETRNLAVCGLC